MAPPMAKRGGFQYLLGDSKTEAARLAAQARLWDPVAHALFDRLGVKPGARVLEIGPGRGSLHLELRRRVQGPIDAVEPSAAFAENLQALCQKDGLGEGKVWNSFLNEARLPSNHYDFIFVRWVFLFLPHPLRHVKQLAKALRPGGRLAVEDYQRETFALIPRPADWESFYSADVRFFATQGGNVNIGAILPHHFRKAGLVVEEMTPHIKYGHPGSDVWNWLSAYFLGVMDRYAKLRPFTPAAARRLRREWLAAAKDPASVLIAPAVVDVVGRKRQRP